MLKDNFFGIQLHVVVVAFLLLLQHMITKRETKFQLCFPSSLLPKALLLNLSGGSRKMQSLLENLLAIFTGPGVTHFMQVPFRQYQASCIL